MSEFLGSRVVVLCVLAVVFVFVSSALRRISVAVVATAGLFCRVLFPVVFCNACFADCQISHHFPGDESLFSYFSRRYFPVVLCLFISRLSSSLVSNGVARPERSWARRCLFSLFLLVFPLCCFSRSSCCLFGWAFLSVLFFGLCAGCFGSSFFVDSYRP
ncbi:unnamed protein product [Polarella glacialis]|uniref:Uncharacterized protein n=1 Tax=Polarella glacialis TaxID=89957 RepID=A0A813JNC5_POLGL|nr:unnamed protein product [Polarella glacialis]